MLSTGSSRPGETVEKRGVATLPARLVADLREVAIDLQHSAAEQLSVITTGRPRGVDMRRAAAAELWHLDAARRLIDKLGVTELAPVTAVVLLPDDHPLLVCRALTARLECERQRNAETCVGFARSEVKISEMERFLTHLRKSLRELGAATEREAGHLADGHHPELADGDWPI